MPAFAVTNVSISDMEKFKKYLSKIKGLIEKYDGEYIIRGPVNTVIEGLERENEKVVVSKFPNLEQARSYYSDAQYVEGRILRAGASQFRTVIIDA